ncbi:MAG: phosphoribosyl-ATP pyrophosphohydrolase [bacterium]|nr:phosphoribosyl-ATP pyrophosphohydrolase [bacterium]
MVIKKYNKLIRDRILEIIKGAGERPYWRILNKKEYLEEVKKKVVEETKELAKVKNKKEIINEVVDIQELLDVLISKLGLTKSQIKKRQKAKNKKRGGFKKRLFLIKTEK